MTSHPAVANQSSSTHFHTNITNIGVITNPNSEKHSQSPIPLSPNKGGQFPAAAASGVGMLANYYSHQQQLTSTKNAAAAAANSSSQSQLHHQQQLFQNSTAGSSNATSANPPAQISFQNHNHNQNRNQHSVNGATSKTQQQQQPVTSQLSQQKSNGNGQQQSENMKVQHVQRPLSNDSRHADVALEFRKSSDQIHRVIPQSAQQMQQVQPHVSLFKQLQSPTNATQLTTQSQSQMNVKQTTQSQQTLMLNQQSSSSSQQLQQKSQNISTSQQVQQLNNNNTSKKPAQNTAAERDQTLNQIQTPLEYPQQPGILQSSIEHEPSNNNNNNNNVNNSTTPNTLNTPQHQLFSPRAFSSIAPEKVPKNLNTNLGNNPNSKNNGFEKISPLHQSTSFSSRKSEQQQQPHGLFSATIATSQSSKNMFDSNRNHGLLTASTNLQSSGGIVNREKDMEITGLTMSLRSSQDHHPISFSANRSHSSKNMNMITALSNHAMTTTNGSNSSSGSTTMFNFATSHQLSNFTKPILSNATTVPPATAVSQNGFNSDLSRGNQHQIQSIKANNNNGFEFTQNSSQNLDQNIKSEGNNSSGTGLTSSAVITTTVPRQIPQPPFLSIETFPFESLKIPVPSAVEQNQNNNNQQNLSHNQSNKQQQQQQLQTAIGKKSKTPPNHTNNDNNMNEQNKQQSANNITKSATVSRSKKQQQPSSANQLQQSQIKQQQQQQLVLSRSSRAGIGGQIVTQLSSQQSAAHLSNRPNNNNTNTNALSSNSNNTNFNLSMPRQAVPGSLAASTPLAQLPASTQNMNSGLSSSALPQNHNLAGLVVRSSASLPRSSDFQLQQQQSQQQQLLTHSQQSQQQQQQQQQSTQSLLSSNSNILRSSLNQLKFTEANTTRSSRSAATPAANNQTSDSMLSPSEEQTQEGQCLVANPKGQQSLISNNSNNNNVNLQLEVVGGSVSGTAVSSLGNIEGSSYATPSNAQRIQPYNFDSAFNSAASLVANQNSNNNNIQKQQIYFIQESKDLYSKKSDSKKSKNRNSDTQVPHSLSYTSSNNNSAVNGNANAIPGSNINSVNSIQKGNASNNIASNVIQQSASMLQLNHSVNHLGEQQQLRSSAQFAINNNNNNNPNSVARLISKSTRAGATAIAATSNSMSQSDHNNNPTNPRSHHKSIEPAKLAISTKNSNNMNVASSVNESNSNSNNKKEESGNGGVGSQASTFRQQGISSSSSSSLYQQQQPQQYSLLQSGQKWEQQSQQQQFGTMNSLVQTLQTNESFIASNDVSPTMLVGSAIGQLFKSSQSQQLGQQQQQHHLPSMSQLAVAKNGKSRQHSASNLNSQRSLVDNSYASELEEIDSLFRSQDAISDIVHKAHAQSQLSQQLQHAALKHSSASLAAQIKALALSSAVESAGTHGVAPAALVAGQMQGKQQNKQQQQPTGIVVTSGSGGIMPSPQANKKTSYQSILNQVYMLPDLKLLQNESVRQSQNGRALSDRRGVHENVETTAHNSSGCNYGFSSMRQLIPAAATTTTTTTSISGGISDQNQQIRSNQSLSSSRSSNPVAVNAQTIQIPRYAQNQDGMGYAANAAATATAAAGGSITIHSRELSSENISRFGGSQFQSFDDDRNSQTSIVPVVSQIQSKVVVQVGKNPSRYSQQQQQQQQLSNFGIQQLQQQQLLLHSPSTQQLHLVKEHVATMISSFAEQRSRDAETISNQFAKIQELTERIKTFESQESFNNLKLREKDIMIRVLEERIQQFMKQSSPKKGISSKTSYQVSFEKQQTLNKQANSVGKRCSVTEQYVVALPAFGKEGMNCQHVETSGGDQIHKNPELREGANAAEILDISIDTLKRTYLVETRKKKQKKSKKKLISPPPAAAISGGSKFGTSSPDPERRSEKGVAVVAAGKSTSALNDSLTMLQRLSTKKVQSATPSGGMSVQLLSSANKINSMVLSQNTNAQVMVQHSIVRDQEESLPCFANACSSFGGGDTENNNNNNQNNSVSNPHFGGDEIHEEKSCDFGFEENMQLEEKRIQKNNGSFGDGIFVGGEQECCAFADQNGMQVLSSSLVEANNGIGSVNQMRVTQFNPLDESFGGNILQDSQEKHQEVSCEFEVNRDAGNGHFGNSHRPVDESVLGTPMGAITGGAAQAVPVTTTGASCFFNQSFG